MGYVLAAPGLDFLNSTFYMFTTVIVAIVAVIGFLVYRYYIEPPLSRKITSAKWGGGVCAFIEDDTGNVDFLVSNKQLPEGVIHNKRGWFLLPRRPHPEDMINVTPEEEANKPKRGRPFKNPPAQDATVSGGFKAHVIDLQDKKRKVAEEEKEYLEAEGIILRTPILRGFGKQVFFGSTQSAALTGLSAIAHADLRKVRQISPKMFQKTQLDALATGNRLEGIKMARQDGMKLIYLAIAAAMILGTMGLVVFLILNRG